MFHRYIEEMWKTFEAMVIPTEAGEQQRIDMRMAFFCGASSLYMKVMSGLSAGDEPMPEDIELLESMKAEIAEFGKVLDASMLSAISKVKA